MIARSDAMVGMVQQVLEDEPYHYHSKMIMKEPRVGGVWEWRQDYGYWYQNGVLMPDLCSVVIAVDPATKENGCLRKPACILPIEDGCALPANCYRRE